MHRYVAARVVNTKSFVQAEQSLHNHAEAMSSYVTTAAFLWLLSRLPIMTIVQNPSFWPTAALKNSTFVALQLRKGLRSDADGDQVIRLLHLHT